jgi:hypothetical protein
MHRRFDADGKYILEISERHREACRDFDYVYQVFQLADHQAFDSVNNSKLPKEEDISVSLRHRAAKAIPSSSRTHIRDVSYNCKAMAHLASSSIEQRVALYACA